MNLDLFLDGAKPLKYQNLIVMIGTSLCKLLPPQVIKAVYTYVNSL